MVRVLMVVVSSEILVLSCMFSLSSSAVLVTEDVLSLVTVSSCTLRSSRSASVSLRWCSSSILRASSLALEASRAWICACMAWCEPASLSSSALDCLCCVSSSYATRQMCMLGECLAASFSGSQALSARTDSAISGMGCFSSSSAMLPVSRMSVDKDRSMTPCSTCVAREAVAAGISEVSPSAAAVAIMRFMVSTTVLTENDRVMASR
mmetsp:Transcript_34674/g.66233  ORF Transcript_34674/g.66233 Transcript_34674/m.66233 type:complete len:208 (-) Transcript_34674:51-674(-)